MKQFIALLLCAAAITAARADEPVRKILTYTVTHPMKTVTGNCADVQVRGLAVKKANNVISAGAFEVIVPIAGMSSGNRNRDSTMQTLLGYPGASEWTAQIEPAQVNGPGGVFHGVLRLGQKSAPLHSDFQVSEEHGEIVVRGSAVVLLSDFQIERPRLLLLAVDNEIRINYEFSIKSP
jgi:hypothetical protein